MWYVVSKSAVEDSANCLAKPYFSSLGSDTGHLVLVVGKCLIVAVLDGKKQPVIFMPTSFNRWTAPFQERTFPARQIRYVVAFEGLALEHSNAS